VGGATVDDHDPHRNSEDSRMRKIPVYVFFGRPGSGKGALSRLVRERCEAFPLSTGAAMTAWAEGPSPEQKALKAGLARGEYGSDELAAGIVDDAMSNLPSSTPAVIFDGFPRNIGQFRAWIATSPAVFGALIDLPEAEAAARIAARLTCPADKRSGFPGETVCSCGRRMERRADDVDPKVVARRFEKYRETVPEVVAAWQAMGLPLRHIDNRGPVAVLRRAAAEMAVEIEARRPRQPTACRIW